MCHFSHNRLEVPFPWTSQSFFSPDRLQIFFSLSPLIVLFTFSPGMLQASFAQRCFIHLFHLTYYKSFSPVMLKVHLPRESRDSFSTDTRQLFCPEMVEVHFHLTCPFHLPSQRFHSKSKCCLGILTILDILESHLPLRVYRSLFPRDNRSAFPLFDSI